MPTGERMRNVGGIYGFDRWHVTSSLEVNYGVRFDRYDYVAGSDFVSPRVGFRLHVLPETKVTLLAAEHIVAPGADEFLPPPSAGPWLPPWAIYPGYALLVVWIFLAGRVLSRDVPALRSGAVA